MRVAYLIALAGCYSPEPVAACTVACVSDADCSDGMTCDGALCRRDDVDCSLVGWWKLDEGVGVTAADATGRAGACVLGPGGAMWTPDGKQGAAVDLDGKVGHVDCGNPTIVTDLPQLTVAAWIRPLDLDVAAAGPPRFVAKEAALMGGRWFLGCGEVTGSSANRLAFRAGYSSGDLERATAGGEMRVGVWQHVAATWDGSPTATSIHLYLDGTEVPASGVVMNGAGNRVPEVPDSFLSFGNEPTLMHGYHGTLDDVRVYARVLSAAEIEMLANP
jgi:hypothetical protein